MKIAGVDPAAMNASQMEEHLMAFIEREKIRARLSAAEAQRVAENQWSDPQSPSDWARQFNTTTRTLHRWAKEGKIHVRTITTKSICICIDDVKRLTAATKRT
jgi:hypothetical protein